MAGRLKLRPGRRALLVAGVLFAHWLVLDSVADHLSSRAIDSAMAPRLTAVYLRQLELADPPPAPAPVVPPAAHAPAAGWSSRLEAAPTPAIAASEPSIELPATELAEVVPQTSESEPLPAGPPAEPAAVATADAAEPAAVATADAAEPAAVATADAAEPAAVATADTTEPAVVAMADAAEQADTASPAEHGVDALPFVWPASTRLNYVLTGNYRGEVHGSAQVEWINAEPRYQVNLDVTIGLPFAPLLSRQMRSDGLLRPTGLQPLRYDQRSKMAFQAPRATSLRFRDQQVSTEQGRPLPMPTAAFSASRGNDFRMSVQDSASQFVQLTWLFTTRPQLLVPGSTISFPLALPGRVADWRYQVGEAETLFTRFGPLEAHRVFTAPGTDRRSDLLAEAWFAPQLAHLPVRIRIEQDTAVYLDLMIKEKPEIAAR